MEEAFHWGVATGSASLLIPRTESCSATDVRKLLNGVVVLSMDHTRLPKPASTVNPGHGRGAVGIEYHFPTQQSPRCIAVLSAACDDVRLCLQRRRRLK
jgi:hypothetical protein